ncbi:MAG: hypothetical protein J5507_03465 [Clostridia bacterium]|nr:hypothetical protein [Clostridia bacterium]
MSKEKIRDLIICLIALAVLVLALTTNVFAETDLEALAGVANNNTTTFEQIGEGNTNVNTNTNTASGANNVTAANNSANKTNRNVTAYPDAGVDYSVVAIIVVCGISAVYAYKKIRDYKNF